MMIADLLINVAAVYLGLGLLVGLWLIGGGLRRIDDRAAEAPLSFRLILLPGIAALWPVLLMKLRGGSEAGHDA